MAGLSSRFFNAGYKIPKYMLPIDNETVFSYCINSFSTYFNDEEFVFICRDIYHTKDFIIKNLSRLGVKNFRIVVLNSETRGQADTVIKGLKDYSNISDLTIFNIDTFRPNFKKYLLNSQDGGYLETFIGEGKNWSNILPEHDNIVKMTAEKQQISKYCCTGIYHFNELSYLRDAFNKNISDASYSYLKELFIAPLYNYLIDDGLIVKFTVIDRSDVIFCGTPSEYKILQKK